MSRRAAKRQGSKQPAKAGRAARPAAATPAAATTGRRGGGGSRGFRGLFYPDWARNIISELRKVIWPSREETQNLTLVVIVVAVTIGIVLGVIDFAFSWIVEQTLF